MTDNISSKKSDAIRYKQKTKVEAELNGQGRFFATQRKQKTLI